MSKHSSRDVRVHALAAATALVLSSSVVLPATAAGRFDASGLQSSEMHDRFIVKYRDGAAERSSTANLQRSLTRAAGAAGAGRALGLNHLRRIATGAEVVRSNRKLDRAEAETLMRQLAADPNVEYVEVDKLNRIVLTPNDTNYSQQWGYQDSDAGIRANEAWDVTTGTGSVVAVLDTGITNHSDLNANILPGYDFIIDTFVSRDGDGRDSDATDPGDYYASNECGAGIPGSNSSWHGTHVAGTVAAVTNNAKGVAGTAFGAKVVPVRVLGRCGGYDSDIADAIIWASGGTVSGVPANANPAEVINLSLGGSGACGTTTQNAINSAVGRGSTLVIAAGNGNTNVSNASPANCNNVIAVASITSTGARSSFSNYGSLIDIAAPGSSITSTLNSGTTTPGSESYASYNGTSMATPHVAGVVALLQAASATPKTPAEVETIIKNNFRPFPATPSQTIGPGILDAKKVVDAVSGGGTNAAPVAGFNFSASGLTVTFTDTSTDSDGTIASRSWDFGDGTTSTATNPSKTYSAAGTYTVSLTVTDDDGASNTRTQSVTVTSGGGSQTYNNTTDYTINDNATVDSPITVSGRTGNGPSNASISVNIVHTYRGDLRVDLVAPDGTLYNLHNRSGGSADNIVSTYSRNLTSEALNGTWKLRVNDNANQDTGYINSWSITF